MRSRLAALLAVLLLATFATGVSAADLACEQQPAACVNSEQSCPDGGVLDDCATICAGACSGLATVVPALPEMPVLHARLEASVALVLIATLTRLDPPPPRG